jgi:hypothetical protein
MQKPFQPGRATRRNENGHGSRDNPGPITKRNAQPTGISKEILQMKTEEKQIDPLEQTQEIFDFLQGKIPDGYKIPRKKIPKLNAEQAWTVLWYLQNLYWQPTDSIERCDVCEQLYNTWAEGSCLDYGKAPYSFCNNCINSAEYVKKMRRNPDAEERKRYFAS